LYLAKGEALAKERAKKEKAYQQQQKQQRGVAYADAPEVEYYEQYEEETAYDQGHSNGGSESYTGQDDRQTYYGDEETKGNGYTDGHGHAPGHNNQDTTPVPMTRQATQRAPLTARAQPGLASPPASPAPAQQASPTPSFFPACFVQLPPNNRLVATAIVQLFVESHHTPSPHHRP
jgi:hypothetical protein